MPLQLCAYFFSSSVKHSARRNRCLFLKDFSCENCCPEPALYYFFFQSTSRGVQKTDGFNLHERFHFPFGLELAATLSPYLCTTAGVGSYQGTGWVASMSLYGMVSERGYLKQFNRLWNYPTFQALLFLSHLASPAGITQQAAQQAAQRGLIHCLTPSVQCHPGTHPQRSSNRAAAASQALLLPGPALKNVPNTLARADWKRKKKEKKINPCCCIWAAQKELATPQSYQLLLLVGMWSYLYSACG